MPLFKRFGKSGLSCGGIITSDLKDTGVEDTGVLEESLETTSAAHNTLASALAIKTYVDAHIGGGG